MTNIIEVDAMKISYKAVQSENNGDEIITYGITGFDDGGEILKAEDVFDDADMAESFASLCNELELAPEHFYDVIDDLLAIK